MDPQVQSTGSTPDAVPEAERRMSVPASSPGSPAWLSAQWDAHALAIQSGVQSEVAGVIPAIGRQLLWLKRNSSDSDWSEVMAHARVHRIYSLLELDPLIYHARRAARPVLAEPELLDIIYGAAIPRESGRPDSSIGHRIFAAHLATDRNRAIRRLRQTFAEQIIAAQAGSGKARIAAIWCGYLRELDLSVWNPEAPIDLFLAVDREAKNTASVRKARIHANLHAKTARIWDLSYYGLTQDGVVQSDFDLIYSLGVLDAIDDHILEKFAAKMVGHLAPGGRLYCCNSKAHTPDGVFGEVFLGQKPFSRSRADLEYVLRGIRWDKKLRVAIDEDDEFVRVCVERLRTC